MVTEVEGMVACGQVAQAAVSRWRGLVGLADVGGVPAASVLIDPIAVFGGGDRAAVLGVEVD